MTVLDEMEPLPADTFGKQKDAEVDGDLKEMKRSNGNSIATNMNPVVSKTLYSRNEDNESMENVDLDGDEIMDALWTDAMEIVNDMDANEEDTAEDI